MSGNYTTKLVGTNPVGRGDLDYIDTSAYRFEAVVDWFSFRIKTVTPTQWPHIQRHLVELIGSKPRVTAIDPDTGKEKSAKGAEGITSTVFDFKVYDEIANNGEKLQGLFTHLASKFPLANIPQVTGIEIALDAYSRGQIDSELREMTAWYMAHISATRENVRQYDSDIGLKGANVMIDRESHSRPLDPEQNLRIGSKGAGLSYQIYLKRTDKAGTVDLARNQQRARAEFTLLGDKLAAEGIQRGRCLPATNLPIETPKNGILTSARAGAFHQFQPQGR